MEKDSSTPNTNTAKPVEKRGLGRGLAALLGGGDSSPVPTRMPIQQRVETPVETPKVEVVNQETAPAPIVEAAPIEAIPAKIELVETVLPSHSDGVSAIETELSKEDSEYKVRRLSIESVRPNQEQPRQHFSDARLQELAESICEQGLIQPIIVRAMPDQSYQIIAGERRWRACKMLGMADIPAIVRGEVEQAERSDLASIIENIQRVELNPVELAEAYSKIIKLYDFTQEELAKKLGVSRVSVANTLRLQRLPSFVKDSVVEGKLSEGHARALLALESEDDILALAQEVISQSMNVREVEARVRAKIQGVPVQMPADSSKSTGSANGSGVDAKNVAPKSPELLAAEEQLRTIFGTKVQIRGNSKGGVIEIFYSNDDSLNRLLHTLRSAQS